MNLILSLVPILFLIAVMTKKNSWPSHIALPATAGLMFLLRLCYFGDSLQLVSAKVIEGFMSALTPILIVWGAIYLFNTMEKSGAIKTLSSWLESISSNQIAQLMLVGWAFEFMIEGASGFGTPAALAAPILAGLGFPIVRVAILCLIMNSVPVPFAAVGVPTWFGFKELNLTDPVLMEVAFKSAAIHSVAALVIPVLALSFVVSWQKIRKNIVFIMLSILSCVIPYIVVANFSYEFPALAGGLLGIILTAVLAAKGIGLEKETVEEKEKVKIPAKELIKASFPLWGTVVVLLLTRLKFFGLNTILRSNDQTLNLNFGIFDFDISAALVLKISHILGTDVSSKLELLYVPSIIPFILVSLITFAWYGSSKADVKEVTKSSFSRMIYPAVALFFAVAYVKILMMGGDNSSAKIIGNQLASSLGGYWKYFASYLGALGAFFSGSCTVSNLTFSGIQNSAAIKLGLNPTTIAALQSVGGSMGNMICIHNIVAVSTVLGLQKQEGFILKRTVVTMAVYGVIAAFSAAIFF